MTVFWFALFLVALVVEFSTAGLVSIWFALGALCTMGIAYLTENIFIQLVFFVIISLVSLILTKPLIKKFKAFDVQPTNSDRVIGKIADVTKDITPNNFGEVKIFGEYWTAISEEKIKVGTKVRVKAIEGVKLIVEKEEE